MAIAVWSPSVFTGRYPEFLTAVTANPTVFAAYFLEAGDYLNNTDCSPVQDVNKRQRWLNMLTAHIAFLGGVLTADGQPKPVGRVSQAAEGSVSATLEMNTPTSGSGPWFAQSQYGAAFWAATQNLRGARYRARPTYYGQRRGFGVY